MNNVWSATVYDTQTRSQLQTDQDWPAVSSQDEGFLLIEDGSADVYIGPEAPEGKESNWIQTIIPGKGCNSPFARTDRSSPGSTRRGVPARSTRPAFHLLLAVHWRDGHTLP